MSYGFQRTVLDHGYVKYVSHMGSAHSILEAARMSTDNPTGVDPAKDRGTLEYLYRHKHMTPFEFAQLWIEVQVPIFVAREWMRHRTFSYNEMSGRYTQLPDLMYTPDETRMLGKDPNNKQGSLIPLSDTDGMHIIETMIETQSMIRDFYEEYGEMGLANEVARVNLPVAQYTKFRVSGDLRCWLQFLELRMAPGAQYEIRVFANTVSEIIKDLFPDVYALFEEYTLGAVTFSKTEMQMLREMADHDVFKEVGPDYQEALGSSRMREFKAKIGV